MKPKEKTYLPALDMTGNTCFGKSSVSITQMNRKKKIAFSENSLVSKNLICGSELPLANNQVKLVIKAMKSYQYIQKILSLKSFEYLYHPSGKLSRKLS